MAESNHESSRTPLLNPDLEMQSKPISFNMKVLVGFTLLVISSILVLSSFTLSVLNQRLTILYHINSLLGSNYYFAGSAGLLPSMQISTKPFKILQIADVHYADGPSSPCFDTDKPNCSDESTVDFIKRILQKEPPDLAIFTGDNTDGAKNTLKSLRYLLETTVVHYKIPFALIFGNHDDESTASRIDMMKMVADLPFSYASIGPTLSGVGNYVIPLVDSHNKTIIDIILLDSGAYCILPPLTEAKIQGVDGYDWLKSDQLAWFAKEAKSAPNVDSIVFMHIPPRQYNSLTPETVKGDFFDNPPSSGGVDSGFYAACLERKRVKAVMVGHDHINDWCAKYTLQKAEGIQLCYAGGVGYHTYGRKGWNRRVRFIEIDQNGAHSWKVLDDPGLSVVGKIKLW